MKTTRMRSPLSARGRAAALAAVLATALTALGCGSPSFVAPPPDGDRAAGSSIAATYAPKPSDAPPQSPPAAVKPESPRPDGIGRVVELILARPANDDRVYLDRALRRELGAARIRFRVVNPDSPQRATPEALAAAIRTAADHGVAGLIVEPLDQPAVLDALDHALARGCAVLLLDRSLPARRGKAIPRVEFTGIAEAGARVVADVLDVERRLARPGTPRVFVLHHRLDDPYIDRCLASLVDPLRAAGKKPEVVAFEGDLDRAIAAVRKSLGDDPRLDILLFDDKHGMATAINLQREWAQAHRPEFLIAGYSPYDFRNTEVLWYARSFADRSVESFTMKTAHAIRDLLDGKPVGEVVAVPVAFHRKETMFVPTAAPKSAESRKADPSHDPRR